MASIKPRNAPLKVRNQSLSTPLIQIGLGVLFCITIFEFIKSGFFPKIAIWESHTLTILFTTLSSIGAGYIVLRKHGTLKGRHHDLEAKVRESTAQLVAAQERFRGIFQSSRDAIGYATLEGQLVDVNEAYERLLGHSREKILTMRYQDHTPSEYADRNREIAERMRQTGESSTFESEFLRSDGTRVPVELTSFVVPGTDGTPMGLAAIAKDITERKQIEAALAQSNEQRTLVLDFAVEAIYGIDTSGRCTFCNPSCARLLGYKNEKDLLEKNMHDTIHHTRSDGTPYPNTECRIYRAFRLGGSTHVEDEILWRADGTSFPAEYWSHPISKNGEMVGAVVTFVDITERKRAEQELIAAKEAAEAGNRVKSEFLANVSHEIRTPMNGIIGMNELALGTDLTTEQREYLETVKTSCDAMMSVVDDLLKFSRLEAGKLVLEVAELNLRKQLEGWLNGLAGMAFEKGLKLIAEISADIPESLVGDAAKLRQVITNLVGNAVKFTEKGQVRVSAQVSSDDAESVTLHVSIADSGLGIPPEKQEFIFERFTQVNGSATRTYGGMGLGLAICKELTELMGGRISVESELGRGSTFRFSVRLGVPLGCAKREAPVATGADHQATGSGPENLNVLVVEDNPTNLRLVTRLLEKRGHRTLAAENGRRAVEILEDAGWQGIDLALMDLQMPEVDGFEATAIIREREKLSGRHLPIIALTAHALAGYEEKCLNAGMDGFLTKPVNVTELFGAIKNVCARVPQAR